MEQFCEACDRLNKLLDSCQMYSKTCSKRATILKIVFKYLDTDSDMMKLKIAKLILNVYIELLLCPLDCKMQLINSLRYFSDESELKQFDQYMPPTVFHKQKHRQ